MKVEPTVLPEVVEFTPVRHGDDRGWFCETWNESTLANLGFNFTWVQDNESFSATQGTVRGLHYQTDPSAQDKMIRVIAGAILDVAVDLRKSSPTFGHHVAVELTAAAGNQLLIPRGFGHGFCTLVPDCQIAYKVSAGYAPECDNSLRWDDPALGIDWPVTAADAVVSDKDRIAPHLSDATLFA